MAAKVFISYRRGDSAGYAGRLMDRLKTELGSDVLFMSMLFLLARISKKSCMRRSPSAACCSQ
jgi:hypothetical protein